MGTLPKTGSVEVVSDASPEAVWDVVADVTRVGEWSHECQAAAWVGGADAARPGARFRGRNHAGRFGWTRTNEIVSVDPPRELVWRTVRSSLYRDSTEWRITIEPVESGSRIVQSFEVLELSPFVDRLIWRFMPAHRDRRPALQEDLERLAAVARARESRRPY
jgi:hypothetical protein